jgi:FAD:protein FMN transferase
MLLALPMRSAPVALAFVIFVGLPACRTGSPAPALVDDTRMAMGSELRIAVWTEHEAAARAAMAAAFAEFDRLESALSVWREQSDVQRLNAAGTDPVAVGPDLLAVLAAAQHASRETNGAFDVTFGALSNVWRFDHDQDNRVPSASEIAARLPLIDHAAVTTDPAAGTARITRAGVKVHVGGIGKGYAVDRAAALLRAAGFNDFALQAGGDLYASGRRGDRPWRMGLNDPRGAGGASFATIELHNETFSTSGDYERFFLKDGVRYHHILDPRTGQPARLCRSVTIVAASALQADWLSTGVFILGPDEGMALVERLPGVEAVIVTAGNDVKVSSGLRGRLVLERHPTR